MVPLGGGVLVLGWLHLPEVGPVGGELAFGSLCVVPFLCSLFLAGSRGVDPSCLKFQQPLQSSKVGWEDWLFALDEIEMQVRYLKLVVF